MRHQHLESDVVGIRSEIPVGGQPLRDRRGRIDVPAIEQVEHRHGRDEFRHAGDIHAPVGIPSALAVARAPGPVPLESVDGLPVAPHAHCVTLYAAAEGLVQVLAEAVHVERGTGRGGELGSSRGRRAGRPGLDRRARRGHDAFGRRATREVAAMRARVASCAFPTASPALSRASRRSLLAASAGARSTRAATSNTSSTEIPLSSAASFDRVAPSRNWAWRLGGSTWVIVAARAGCARWGARSCAVTELATRLPRQVARARPRTDAVRSILPSSTFADPAQDYTNRARMAMKGAAMVRWR